MYLDEIAYLKREAESDFPKQEECCEHCGIMLTDKELADGCEWCTECWNKYLEIEKANQPIKVAWNGAKKIEFCTECGENSKEENSNWCYDCMRDFVNSSYGDY